MNTYIYHYWLNKILCWHGRKSRKAIHFDGKGGGLAGTEIYCTECWRKHTALYFDPEKAWSK